MLRSISRESIAQNTINEAAQRGATIALNEGGQRAAVTEGGAPYGVPHNVYLNSGTRQYEEVFVFGNGIPPEGVRLARRR